VVDVRGLLAVGLAVVVVVAVPLSARGDGGSSTASESRPLASGSTVTGDPSAPARDSLVFPDADLPTPAATSGPLAAPELPAPAALGQEWRPFADPGGHEAGFAGNGTWTRARDVGRVLSEIAPLGCPGGAPAADEPPPQYALEGTYRHLSDGAAVSLLLEWADEDGAATFMRQHGAAVAACLAPRRALQPGAPLRLAIEARVVGDDRIVDVRRELGTGAAPVVWTEVVVRADRRVGLLIVGVPAGDPAPDAGRLSRALAAALAH